MYSVILLLIGVIPDCNPYGLVGFIVLTSYTIRKCNQDNYALQIVKTVNYILI